MESETFQVRSRVYSIDTHVPLTGVLCVVLTIPRRCVNHSGCYPDKAIKDQEEYERTLRVSLLSLRTAKQLVAHNTSTCMGERVQARLGIAPYIDVENVLVQLVIVKKQFPVTVTIPSFEATVL